MFTNSILKINDVDFQCQSYRIYSLFCVSFWRPEVAFRTIIKWTIILHEAYCNLFLTLEWLLVWNQSLWRLQLMNVTSEVHGLQNETES